MASTWASSDPILAFLSRADAMKMESPAGEFDVTFESVCREKDKLVIHGKTGVWDSRMYVDVDELGSLLKVMISKGAISFLLLWPYFTLKRRFGKRKAGVK
jgi:hypothetical protein